VKELAGDEKARFLTGAVRIAARSARFLTGAVRIEQAAIRPKNSQHLREVLAVGVCTSCSGFAGER